MSAVEVAPDTGRHLGAPRAGAATATYRRDPARNQDAHVVLRTDADGVTAVVVADGVGSWERSGEAAIAAVHAAAAVLRHQGAWALRPAVEAARKGVLDLGDDDGPAGTTLLIVAVPAPGQVLTAYVGNGALLAVGPAWPTAAAGAHLRWSNLLLPHSGVERGREVLLRALTTASHEPVEPTLAWHVPGGPVAVAAVTDGIWSSEQAPVGVTGDGARWAELSPVLARSVATVEAVLAEPDTDPGVLLAAHLDALADEGLLEDDATVGVVVP